MSRSDKILKLAREKWEIESDFDEPMITDLTAICDMPIIFLDNRVDNPFPNKLDVINSPLRATYLPEVFEGRTENELINVESQENILSILPEPDNLGLLHSPDISFLQPSNSMGNFIVSFPVEASEPIIEQPNLSPVKVQPVSCLGATITKMQLSNEKHVGKPLVSYSDSDYTDSDYSLGEPENQKVKRRKRCQVNAKQWLDRCNAKKREKGQDYFGRKKQDNKWDNKVPRIARKMKARCSCSSLNGVLKCPKISDEARKQIFDSFWLLNWGEKKIYVDGLVKMIPTNRPRGRKDTSLSRRSHSMYYHLKFNDNLFRVCKTMFLNTLDIGKTAVWNWKQCSKENFAVSRESNHSATEIAATKKVRNNPFQNQVDSLKTYLNRLPKMESHYCRKDTSKYYLLPEWTSKKSLYDYYVSDWCSTNNVLPVSVAKFNNTLDTENISLFHPKKDACEKCMSYKLGFVSEEEYKKHTTRKEQARAEKEKDKNREDYVFAVDVQALLSAPKSNVSSLYYKSKLNVHNFCALDLKTKEAYCFLWNETEGGVSAEEFASVISYFLIDKVLPQILDTRDKKVVIYSDGCAAQNRNVTASNALINVAMTRNIVIEQKYLEVGHTQMEVDSMHASIEKKLRNKIINIPAEYIGICRSARKNPKPYNVEYLEHSFFKSFDDVKFLKSIRPGKMKGDLKVNEIRALKYTANGDVFYKVNFEEEWKLLPQRREKMTNPKEFAQLPNLHSDRLPLTIRKFQDLQDLKICIPTDYHSYYNNLPHK